MSERCIDRLRFLRRRLKDQRAWIESHGGTLAAYIQRYGDPGVPPCDENGNAKTLSCPDKELAMACGLRPVPNAEGCYYQEHFGSGGTLIYEADMGALGVITREWAEYESRYGRYLDAEERRNEPPAKFYGLTGNLTEELLLADIEAFALQEFESAKQYLAENKQAISSDRRRGLTDLIDILGRLTRRLHLGRRVLGLQEPSLAGDPAMQGRPWDESNTSQRAGR